MIRRLIMTTALFMILVLAGFSCSSDGDNNSFTSSVSLGHTHDVTLDFRNPFDLNEAIETTETLNHRHTLALTETDYDSVNGGSVITVPTTEVDAHSHTFTFRL